MHTSPPYAHAKNITYTQHSGASQPFLVRITMMTQRDLEIQMSGKANKLINRSYDMQLNNMVITHFKNKLGLITYSVKDSMFDLLFTKEMIAGFLIVYATQNQYFK